MQSFSDVKAVTGISKIAGGLWKSLSKDEKDVSIGDNRINADLSNFPTILNLSFPIPKI
jgi:hypothetical protein